jgi:hypothetical protein
VGGRTCMREIISSCHVPFQIVILHLRNGVGEAPIIIYLFHKEEPSLDGGSSDDIALLRYEWQSSLFAMLHHMWLHSEHECYSAPKP